MRVIRANKTEQKSATKEQQQLAWSLQAELEATIRAQNVKRYAACVANKQALFEDEVDAHGSTSRQ